MLPARQQETLRRTFARAGADEGTLWRLDEGRTALLPVWNSGPAAALIVGKHRQPLASGLISLVCITEQPLCENAVHRHAGQDPTLDRSLGKLTCAMIAVPLHCDGVIQGVISCVKLRPADSPGPDPPGFDAADLRLVAEAAERIGRSLELPSP